MSLKMFFITTLFISISIVQSFAQWNPVSSEESFLVSNRQTQFFVFSGTAALSVMIAKLTSKEPELSYYQAHIGYFNGDGYSVFMQNFGVEQEFAPWHSLKIEGNINQFTGEDYTTVSIGFRMYSRWSAFGKKKLSPYFEYSMGILNAFQAFPEGGSRFNFHQTLALGLQYKLANRNKIRLDYDTMHLSNNNLFDSNPGFDTNGITLSYSWFWK